MIDKEITLEGANNISGAIRTALSILDCWGCSDEEAQAVLGTSAAEYDTWRVAAPEELPDERLKRISCVLGIWAALQVLLPQDHERWPRLTNNSSTFQGRKPIELMTDGKDGLQIVRKWLDGWLHS